MNDPGRDHSVTGGKIIPELGGGFLRNQHTEPRHAREVRQRELSFTVQTFLSMMYFRQPSDVEYLRERLLKMDLPA